MRVTLVLDQRQLADARIGLAQLEAVLPRQPHQANAGAIEKLGVGGERDRLLLHGGVDHHLAQLAELHRLGLHSDGETPATELAPSPHPCAGASASATSAPA